MKKVIDKADSRGHANHGWLDTYHTFSFANYYNPERINFGALRVLNDDTVAPSEGFGMHPHRNMEVISIPLEGSMEHGDSIENSEVITVGDIQVMSTGKGIVHSEYNKSSTEVLKFLQIWVVPKANETEPQYNSFDIRKTQKRNSFGLIISPDGDAPASILQDAWFSLGDFDKGAKSEYKLHNKNSGVYIFMIEGEAKVEDIQLSRRDGVGIYDTEKISFEVVSNDAKILLIEVPMSLTS